MIKRSDPFAPLLARGDLLLTAMCELALRHRVSPSTYTDLWASGRSALAVRFGVRPDGTPQWPADAQRDALFECYLEATS
jgi:hypothetical protein